MDNLDELDQAFSNYENVVNKETKAAQQKRDDTATFLKDFENVALTIIEPAFKEILEEVKKRGHDGDVYIKPYVPEPFGKEENVSKFASVKFLIRIKGMKWQYRESEPCVFFNARFDKAESREIQATYNLFPSGQLESGSHISFGHISQKAGGTYVLENITHEIAKNEAINFIKVLFSDVQVK